MADFYTVELGFTTGLTLDDATEGVLNTSRLGNDAWIDVSDYVTGISVKRGKNRDIDRISAGSLSIDFRNDDRVFDPTNTASPFFGRIVPRSKIRVSASIDRSSGLVSFWQVYYLFTGYVNDWNFAYNISGDLTASVDASDGFTVLARQELVPGTAVQQLSGARVTAVLDMTTVKWPSTARVIDTGLSLLGTDVFDGNVLDYLQTVADSENGLLFMGKNGDVEFVDRGTTLVSQSLSDPIYNYWQYSPIGDNALDYVGSITAGSYKTLWIVGPEIGGDYGIEVWLDSPSTVATYKLMVSNAANKGSAFTSPVTLQFYFGSSYSVDFYVNIYWRNNLGSLLATSTQGFSYDAGHYYPSWDIVPPTGATKFDFEFQTSQKTNLYEYVYFYFNLGGFQVSETGAQEFFDGYSLPTATETFSWVSTPYRSASTLQKITYVTPPLIFADDGSGIPYQNVNMQYGTELMMNQAEFTSPAGTAVSNNDASQRVYGIVAGSVGTLVSTVAQLQALADYRVAKYAYPELRFETISVELKSLTALQRTKVLALEIGDLCELTFTPKGSGFPISQVAQIIGISNNIQADRHSMDFSFEVIPFTFFVLNDVAYGKLDGIGTLGF